MKTTLKEKISQFGQKVSEKIQEIFQTSRLNQVARKVGFVKRNSSRIKGKEFVELMSVEMLQEPEISYEGLCESLEDLNPRAKMTPQGLAQRVNTEEAVKYLKEVLEQVITESVKLELEKLNPGWLSIFKHVYIEDSTQGSLNEKLAEKFRWSGGSASKASWKADLVYEVKQQLIDQLQVTAGVVADQQLGKSLVDKIKPWDLVIRDLGYLSLSELSRIAEQGGYYLSRLLKAVAVYLDKDDKSAIELTRYLKKHYGSDSVIDEVVYIGQQERVPCRLIAYRLPEPVVTERRRKAYKEAKKKGRSPSQEYIQWLAFSFYVTNVVRP